MRLQGRNVNTVLYETETTASLGAQFWNLITTSLKRSKSFNEFKKKSIRKCTTKKSPCRVYNVYVPRVYIKVNIHWKYYTFKFYYLSFGNNFE